MGIRIAVDESGKWRSTQTGPDVYPIRNTIWPPARPCPECGVMRHAEMDEEHGAIELCLNPSCTYDK